MIRLLALVLGLVAVTSPARACEPGTVDCVATTADASPWISAAELVRLQAASPRLKLVDVRAAEVFEAYHVAGALNLTPLEIKAKRIWREDPLVLVGSGAAYGALLQLRDELREQGFREVRVLDGGTAYWQDTVEKGATTRARVIEATAFDLVRDRARWVILDFAGQPPQVMPAAARVVLQSATAAEAAQAASSNLASQGRDIRNVLLVADEDTRAAEIAQALGSTPRHNVFVLRGGWTAWDRQQRIARTLADSSSHDALEAQCW